MTMEQWLLQTLRQMATSDAHRHQNQKTIDTLSSKHIETVERLSRYDLEFPTSVRERVRELSETMVFREIERIHDLRPNLDRSQLVTEAANQNEAALDRIVT